MPKIDSETMRIVYTLPVRFEVGPAFTDMGTRIEQVADWEGMGEVLIFQSDMSLVMSGSLVVNEKGEPIAFLNAWGGSDRQIGTPLIDLLAMGRHKPTPLSAFNPENMSGVQQSNAYLQRAQSLRDQGELHKAISDVYASLQGDPDNWLALYERGVLEDMMNTGLQQSERSLEQSIAIEDEWSESQYSLGLVRYKLGKFEEALEPLKHSLRLDDSNPDSYSMLGLTELELGFPEQAFDNLVAACDRDPDAFMYLDNLTIIANELGRDAEIVDRFLRFVEEHPDDAEARFELASLAIRLDRPALALKQYEWLVHQSPDDGELLARMALCQIKTDDLQGARKTLDRVEEVQPDHPYLPALRRALGD